MVGGIVTFIALLALGYLIFVYAGKQTGLNKVLGYVIVGIIVVTLIALPVFACARHFGKGGFQGCAMGKGAGSGRFNKGQMDCGMGIGPGGFCKPGNAPFMPNSECCPGFSGNCEIRIDRFDSAFKDFDPGKDIQSYRKFMPKGSFNDGMEFDGKNDVVEDINDTATWLQKDPKLVDEFIKALKDKPEALKVLKEKLK